MKKVFTLMVVFAAVAMVSCAGNKAKKEAEAAATEVVATEETPAEACCENAENCEKECPKEAAAEVAAEVAPEAVVAE